MFVLGDNIASLKLRVNQTCPQGSQHAYLAIDGDFNTFAQRCVLQNVQTYWYMDMERIINVQYIRILQSLSKEAARGYGKNAYIIQHLASSVVCCV